MSELKSFRIKEAEEGSLFWEAEYEVYSKIEVDKVIAEKDAEIARLKATPEEIMKEVFDKVIIYPHEMVRLEDAYRLAVSLRKMKRAFYKACANWAFLAQWERGELKENWEKWEKVECKCGAKAREYK